MKYDLKDTTFIIPIRIDSSDRLRNIFLTINYLSKNFETNIIIKESDKESLYNKHLKQYFGDTVKYIFEENHNSYFHKTRLLNDMAQIVSTEKIGIYDADIILPIQSYLKTQLMLNIGYDIVYPFKFGLKGEKKVMFYDKHNYLNNSNLLLEHMFYKEQLNISILENNFFYNINPMGEGYADYGMCQFIKKSVYFEGFLENENFLAYAPEDKEKYYRFNCLGYKIARIDQAAYHLEHSRNHNSSNSNPFREHNEKLWYSITKMNKEKLIEYYSKQEYYKRILNDRK